MSHSDYLNLATIIFASRAMPGWVASVLSVISLVAAMFASGSVFR